MPQPAPTSPLDSHTSDEVRFGYEQNIENLALFEKQAENPEVADALKRALAAAAPQGFSEEAVHTLEGVQAAEVKAREVPHINIEQLYNASRTIVWARQEELKAA